MKEITINMGGKKYTKTNPTLKDYRNLMEYNERNEGKTFLKNPELIDEAIDIIADWYGDVSRKELEEEGDLKTIYDTYKGIESNIAEVFTGVPLEVAIKKLTKILNAQNTAER